MASQKTYIPRRGEDIEAGDISASTVTATTLTGSLVGNITGNVTGGILAPVVEVTANGAITIPSFNTTFVITKAGVCAMTLADPALANNGLRLTFISSDAYAHTLTNTNGFNAGGAGSDVATWAAAIGNSITVIAYGTTWLVENLTGVTLA
jgi:hypothetical protein